MLLTHMHTHSSFPGDGNVSVGAFKHTLSTSSSLALRLLRTHLSFRRQREINGFLIFCKDSPSLSLPLIFSLPLLLSLPLFLSPSFSLSLSFSLSSCVISLLLFHSHSSAHTLSSCLCSICSRPPGCTTSPPCFMSVTLLEIRSVCDGKSVPTWMLSR